MIPGRLEPPLPALSPLFPALSSPPLAPYSPGLPAPVPPIRELH